MITPATYKIKVTMDLLVILVGKEILGSRPLSIPILEIKYLVIILYLLQGNIIIAKGNSIPQ